DLENIVTQLPPLFDAYWKNMDARTCESCGSLQEKP
ncbi:MAG: 3-hydroxyanthranilate 3,4-dioxygenase, partial [Candidatus Marinimicrobia bacterium]|nr:3-hydroxyanthranilate 3,4-dioxygenase [Candidatus Neomarinimicrobiota bacterium]